MKYSDVHTRETSSTTIMTSTRPHTKRPLELTVPPGTPSLTKVGVPRRQPPEPSPCPARRCPRLLPPTSKVFPVTSNSGGTKAPSGSSGEGKEKASDHTRTRPNGEEEARRAGAVASRSPGAPSVLASQATGSEETVLEQEDLVLHGKPGEAVQGGRRRVFPASQRRGLKESAGESREVRSGPPWSRGGAAGTLEAGQAAGGPLHWPPRPRPHAPQPFTIGWRLQGWRAPRGSPAGAVTQPVGASHLLLPQRFLGLEIPPGQPLRSGGPGWDPVSTFSPKAPSAAPATAPGSPLSCSMKHTFPLVLNARVSGVMHRVWKMAAWATLLMDRLHSRHTAHASCSLRPLSRSDRMSARDTFSCQDRPQLRQVWGQTQAAAGPRPRERPGATASRPTRGKQTTRGGVSLYVRNGVVGKGFKKTTQKVTCPTVPWMPEATGHLAERPACCWEPVSAPGAGTWFFVPEITASHSPRVQPGSPHPDPPAPMWLGGHADGLHFFRSYAGEQGIGTGGHELVRTEAAWCPQQSKRGVSLPRDHGTHRNAGHDGGAAAQT